MLFKAKNANDATFGENICHGSFYVVLLLGVFEFIDNHRISLSFFLAWIGLLGLIAIAGRFALVKGTQSRRRFYKHIDTDNLSPEHDMETEQALIALGDYILEIHSSSSQGLTIGQLSDKVQVEELSIHLVVGGKAPIGFAIDTLIDVAKYYNREYTQFLTLQISNNE